MTLRNRFLFLVFVLALLAQTQAAEATWQPTLWNSEKAMFSVHAGWKAIVSLERGRLMHFGPAASGANLLFAPSTRDLPAGWGGHRLWLGPQSTWAKIWPPPAAWEHSGPESFTIAGDELRMLMPDAGDGWPRLTRTYRWNGRQLICGAEIHGGTRPAQIIQIVQVPSATRVSVYAQPAAFAPEGYVRLPAGNLSKLTTRFVAPPQVSHGGDELQLHYTGVAEKLGFRPQPLIGFHGSVPVVVVGRAAQNGPITGEPDQGFSTQVFLGGSEPFIELEQLTPLFSAGTPASFEISIDGGLVLVER